MLLQEFSAICPPSLFLLSGMGAQGLALRLRCRPLLVCGAALALAAALFERDAAFAAGQILILCLCWGPCAGRENTRRGDQKRPRGGGL